MTFSENISLKKYADSAKQKFSESEKRLSQIEGSFQTRMNGKTTGKLIGAIIGTVCWLVAICVGLWYAKDYIDETTFLVCLGLSVALIIALLIDEIIGFAYYGKISRYKGSISQLKNRVSVGRNSIKSNQETFMKSSANGWQHPLSAGTSIPEEAESIENTINGMESLKRGFINGLKNFLFFTFAIVITAVGSWALFKIAGEIMTGISGESIDSEVMEILCIIGMALAVIAEIILAKIVWSKTNCSVTNVTLLIAPVGPVAFLTLVALGAVIVVLAIWAVALISAILGFVIAGACLCGTFSGG